MDISGVYQVKGPFKAGQNVVQKILKTDSNATYPTSYARVGISINTKDWMPFKDFYFNINSIKIQMGRSCMYETSQPIQIDSITFDEDAPASTIINLIGYKRPQ